MHPSYEGWLQWGRKPEGPPGPCQVGPLGAQGFALDRDTGQSAAHRLRAVVSLKALPMPASEPSQGPEEGDSSDSPPTL